MLFHFDAFWLLNISRKPSLRPLFGDPERQTPCFQLPANLPSHKQRTPSKTRPGTQPIPCRPQQCSDPTVPCPHQTATGSKCRPHTGPHPAIPHHTRAWQAAGASITPRRDRRQAPTPHQGTRQAAGIDTTPGRHRQHASATTPGPPHRPGRAARSLRAGAKELLLASSHLPAWSGPQRPANGGLLIAGWFVFPVRSNKTNRTGCQQK